jgi:tetratricopeptide (TPR) repeat protein
VTFATNSGYNSGDLKGAFMRKTITGLLAATAMTLSACASVGTQVAAQQEEVDISANSRTGTYLAANFAAAAGDLDSAAEFYSQMLTEDPYNPNLLERSFLYHAAAGNLGAAIPLAQRVVAGDPENRRAHLVLAVDALMREDYETATEEIALSGRGPFAVLTSAVLDGWALAGQQRTDEALTALSRLNGQQGVEGLHAFHKALILDYSGRTEAADAAYREAMTIVGTAPRATDAFGRFLRRQNRTEDARALYARLAGQNAGNPVAAQALADIAANRTPDRLINSPAEGAAEALFAIAASLNGENGGDVAVLYLNLAIYLRPDFDLARAMLGDRYERLGRHDLAIEVYTKVPSTSPYYPIVQVQSALDAGRLGRIEEAIGKLRVLTNERPQDSDAWTALGDLLRNSEAYEESIPAYDKAISLLRPNDGRLVSLYYARGISYQSTDRWDDAERNFQQALAINPNRADVLNYLGYSWIERGKNLEEAVRMLEKARSLRPNDGYIADSVGWAYYKMRRYQEAAEILEEAVQLAPGASEINDHLGDAYWRIGRKLDARFEWRHALALNPEPHVRPIIERKLELGLDAALASGS